MTKLWVDDIRLPPEGWMWAKTSDEAIAALDQIKTSGEVFEAMSFDHDLGGEDTSRRVVLTMCENEMWPKRVYVHSMNPPGHLWIRQMVERYAPPGTLRR